MSVLNRQDIHRSRETGSALLEFVLSLTVILTLTFGVIDYGLGLRQAQVLADAARSSARAAAGFMSDAQMKCQLCGACAPTVPVSCSCVERYARSAVQSYLNDAGLDGVSSTLGDAINLEVCFSRTIHIAGETPKAAKDIRQIQIALTRNHSYFPAMSFLTRAFPTVEVSSTFELEKLCSDLGGSFTTC